MARGGSEGCSQGSSRVMWSGWEQRTRSELRCSEAEAAHRAKKQETKTMTSSKNLVHNSSQELGWAKSGHPSSSPRTVMGLVTNCSSIVWAPQMGLRKPLTFWSKRSEVETSFRAVQQWHCTSQAALWKAGSTQLKTQRGSCGKASRAGFAAGTWLWYWLVCAAHQNGLAEVYTKVYSC